MLRHALRIAAKDLRIELRAREIVPTMTLFAALVAILSSMALFVDEQTGRTAAPGVLWIAIAFSGTLGLSRTWGREREEGALKGILLSPVSPAALFAGKAIGAFVFVLLTEVVVAALVAVMLHAPVADHFGPFALLVLLGTLGFVGAGTLFGAMTARTRARDLLLAVVLYPLVSPALLCGVVATREVFNGVPLGELWDWVKLLAAFDVVTLVRVAEAVAREHPQLTTFARLLNNAAATNMSHTVRSHLRPLIARWSVLSLQSRLGYRLQVERLWSGGALTCLALALGASSCTQPIDSAQTPKAFSPAQESTCSDAEYDHDRDDLNVECGPVRAAVAVRRTRAEQRDLDSQIVAMHDGFHHRHVPRAQLIEFMRPADGMGRPLDDSGREAYDRATAMLLCDRYARTVATHHYLAEHPEYLQVGGGR